MRFRPFVVGCGDWVFALVCFWFLGESVPSVTDTPFKRPAAAAVLGEESGPTRAWTAALTVISREL